MIQYIIVATSKGELHRIPQGKFDNLPKGAVLTIDLDKEDTVIGIATLYCEEPKIRRIS